MVPLGVKKFSEMEKTSQTQQSNPFHQILYNFNNFNTFKAGFYFHCLVNSPESKKTFCGTNINSISTQILIYFYHKEEILWID